jgi:hypothetical protein
MTLWSEDDFLERIMPQSRQKDRVPLGGCPDSESLCAFAEDRVRGVVRDAIVGHLGECPECAELHDRLLKFAAVHPAEDDKDWERAERRLDNWMHAFLSAREDAVHSTVRSRKVGTGREVTYRWNWSRSWKSQWAVGLAAAVVLLAITPILFRHGFQAQHPTQTAVATTEAPTTPQPVVAPSPITPEIQRANPAPAAKPPEAGLAVEDATKQHEQSGKPLPLPLEHGLSSAAPDVSARRETQPLVQQESQPRLSSSVRNPVPNEASQNLESAPQRTNNSAGGKPATTSRLVADATQTRSAMQYPTAQRSAPVVQGMAMEGAAKLPESIRLEVGTRVWIRLGSVARQPDGSINFQGTLVEPVSQANAIALDRGTEVDGYERDEQGRTSLTVTGIVVRGVRFTLKNAAGAARTGAGRGSTVPFDNRQVLETFIEGTSVYDKAAEVTGRK